MTTFARGLAASLVVSLALLAACTSGDDSAPTTSARPPIASSKVTPRSTTTSTTSATSTVVPSSSTSSTTSSSTTAPTSTMAVPPPTGVLAPDQQATTADEVRALVGALPATAPDPEAATIAASIEGALSRVADGSLTPDDFFLAAGDFLPSGVVINPYLVCPLSLGEKCTATLDDYLPEMTKFCAGLTIQLSVVEGPLGPAGAGTCVWRPTNDQRAAAAALVEDALLSVITATTNGWSPSEPLTAATQTYADWVSQHPFENARTSTAPDAEAVVAALVPFAGEGYLCSYSNFNTPAGLLSAEDVAEIEESIRSHMGERLAATAIPKTATATAIGSGRLWVTWCTSDLS